MSRCRCGCGCGYGNRAGYSCGNRVGSSCGSGCCNFPSFIILILILLQFKNNGSQGLNCESLNNQSSNGIDKGILFIIALFYLSCCNPCSKGLYGRY